MEAPSERVSVDESKIEVDRQTTATTSGKLRSYWVESKAPEFYLPLHRKIEVDVVVIGGGIAGLTTAYLLCKEGLQCVVVDDGPIGGGETGRTTAHLTNALDDRYYVLENMFGPEKTRLVASSHGDAIDHIAQIVSQEGMDCDFERVDGYLFLDPSDQPESLLKEKEAAHRAGLTRVELVDQAPLPFSTGPSLKFPDQAQFHPLKYLTALSSSIVRYCGGIYTETRITEFAKNVVVTDKGYEIEAKHIVVSTNTPVNDRLVIHTKQAAYRTYVVAGSVLKGSISKALFWDTGDQSKNPSPYHYIRLHNLNKKSDLLIVGGSDHKVGQKPGPEQSFAALEGWVQERFPMMKQIQHRWSGQIQEPVDSLGFIGRHPSAEDVYIATGDSGNGMTYGTIAGRLITDLILGRQSPLEELYDPGRQTLRTVGDFLQENLNVAAQFVSYLKRDEASLVQSLKLGDGMVLRKGTESLAAYRDIEAHLHTHSAICPHMKCIVTWNALERSFDCPCHGSRFTGRGEAINGPAKNGLRPAKMKSET
jgi:glycine/D-amino acid oxidase-like deaminating enzyme/nitrite reductase/ring-hydroxylating ferredoxin subunit